MKTIKQRKSEMDVIFDKLTNLGITEEFENIKKFKEMAEDYIETGQSYSGRLKIKEIEYILFYLLSNNESIENSVTIRRS
jgi:hypothetical protein